jgi:hypothetical protein
MENRDAYGYKPVGYVKTEEEAKEIVKNGKTYTNEDCWQIGYINKTEPEFYYETIKEM